MAGLKKRVRLSDAALGVGTSVSIEGCGHQGPADAIVVGDDVWWSGRWRRATGRLLRRGDGVGDTRDLAATEIETAECCCAVRAATMTSAAS